MFYLGGAQTPVALSLAAEQGVVIAAPFDTYFRGASLPSAVLVVAIPAVVYALMRPEVRATPWARREARARLAARGRPGWREGLVLAVLLGAVGLWVRRHQWRVTRCDRAALALLRAQRCRAGCRSAGRS